MFDETPRCLRQPGAIAASIRTIERVATVLRSDEDDYTKLLCLDAPEIARVSASSVRKVEA
jgi:hypothetical protein